MMNKFFTICLAAVAFGLFHVGNAEDWPRYMHDNYNSGVSSERIAFPLVQSWCFIANQAPNPAWPAPARADFWHEKPRLDPRVTYDRAFHVTVAHGLLYFASSSSDKVYCLDAESGEQKWTFYTKGPNRIAPMAYRGKIYVGSDDGRFYCLDARSGKLLWQYSAVENARRIPGNGRVISIYPIRTGAVIQNHILYFIAGLFPKEGVYLCALNPDDGSELWKKKEAQLSPQGYLVSSKTKLYIANGRSQPSIIDLKNGDMLKRLSGAGGTYLALENDDLVYGTQDTGLLSIQGTDAADPLNFAMSGLRFISKNNFYYVASENNLLAVNKTQYRKAIKEKHDLKAKLKAASEKLKALRVKRKSLKGKTLTLEAQIDKQLDFISELGAKLKSLDGAEFAWQQKVDRPYAMILAGEAAVLGMDKTVAAYNISDGKKIWSMPVDGRAYGLAAANGKLYVSTDTGSIYCFGAESAAGNDRIVERVVDNPFAKDKNSRKYAAAARHILKHAKVNKGYCLVLNFGTGRLAYELAKRSQLNIIGIEKNKTNVDRARQVLDAAGLLGNRITVFQGSLSDQHFTKYLANLIVSDRLVISKTMPEPADEVYRVLQPAGGVAYLGQLDVKSGLKRNDLQKWMAAAKQSAWKIDDKKGLWAQVRRGNLAGAGEWTHLYADPGNTAATKDELVGNDISTQWFGRPGPREMTDRHHRTVTPLYKNGIVYIPGDNHIIAADAYNGTMLWDNTVPNFRRLAAPRDAGNMALTDDFLYAAVDARCYGFDPRTGEQLSSFVVPQLIPRQTRYWGYLATVGKKLFGSGRKPEAAYTLVSKQEDYEIQWGDYKTLVTSDYLFSMDRYKGKVLWTYKSGVILNPSIAIDNGKMYFIENRNEASKADKDGLIDLKTFLGDETFLVAVDLHSGKLVWKNRFDFTACQHVLYLSALDNVLLAVGSKNKNNKVWYDLYGFDASDGQVLWHQEQNNEAGIGGDHGEQIHHPVIANGRVYAEPYSYDLHSGQRIDDWKLVRGGGGCGTISGSPSFLFFRAANPAMCDVMHSSKGEKINFVTRPGCWINIIPAGGLVIIPEASSGCTCNYPLQMSVAYLSNSTGN